MSEVVCMMNGRIYNYARLKWLVQSQPINGGKLWVGIKIGEVRIGDVTHKPDNSVDMHVSLVTMLTLGEKWERQFQRAAKRLDELGSLSLCLLRNDDVPSNKSPSVYHIKLQFGDCMSFGQLSQMLAAGGEIYGCAKTLGAPRGPVFHVSIHEWQPPHKPTRPCPA